MKKLLITAGLAWLAVVRAWAITPEELAADPQLWPPEVAVLANVRGTILKDGKPAGAMLVGKGIKLAVMGVAAGGITGRFGSNTVLVPIEKTNLWSEVARLHPDAGTAVAEPAPAAPEPKPAPVAAAPTATDAARPPSAMQRRLAGHLVRLEQDSLRRVDARELANAKYIGLYYSASWCGPCRQFTPQFVQVYRQLKQRYPEFEVVFISADRSAGDMKGYMRDDKMPWLAVDYDTAQGNEELRRYCGPGIPCLVLVDPQGRVVSDSFDGDNYVGPGQVLQDAQRLLAQSH